MIKNIFFDFDGVLVESVNVKTQAFKNMYSQYGKVVAQNVVKHHTANGGMSRYEKFKLYHKKFLNIELKEEDLTLLTKRFSSLVKHSVINAIEVNGSHNFIRDFKNVFNMFVITGTPTEEAREICKDRGIIDCFKGVYGSPQKKEYWCAYILRKYKFDLEETIFVGDAMADYNAAIDSNIDFYLRENEENKQLFSKINGIVRFNNFEDFKQKVIR